MGCFLLVFDIIVLFVFLIYIDLKCMMYMLIVLYVFSCVIDLILDGGYFVKGLFVVFNKSEEIVLLLMIGL